MEDNRILKGIYVNYEEKNRLLDKPFDSEETIIYNRQQKQIDSSDFLGSFVLNKSLNENQDSKSTIINYNKDKLIFN